MGLYYKGRLIAGAGAGGGGVNGVAPEELQAALALKQDKLKPDDTLNLTAGGNIGVALPTRVLSQEEWDALPEAEKKPDVMYAVLESNEDGADGGAQGAACGVNLLDNWYLANPVNQRGQTEYSGSGFGIDRWRNLMDNCKLVVRDGFVSFMATNNSIANFAQKLDMEEPETGTPITISVLLADGSFYTQSGPIKESGACATIHIPSVGVLYYVRSNNWIVIDLYAGQQLDLKAIKLEPGDRQTMAHKEGDTWVLNDPPPNKALELLKCQRYYFRTSRYDSTGCVTTGATQYIMPITTPVQMRISPTAKMDGYFARLYNGYSKHTGSVITAPTKLSTYTGPSNGTHQVVLMDTIESAVDTNNTVVYYQIKNLELDANL